jgi:hypothetical protein
MGGAQRPTACAQQRRPVAVDHRISSCSTFEATMQTTCGAPSTSRMEKHDMNENDPRKNGAWPTLLQGTFQGAKEGSIGSIKHPNRELHIVPSRRWWLRGGSRYGLKYALVWENQDDCLMGRNNGTMISFHPCNFKSHFACPVQPSSSIAAGDRWPSH